MSILAKFKYRRYSGSTRVSERIYGPYGPYFYSAKRNGDRVVFRYLGRNVNEVAKALGISEGEAHQKCLDALLHLLERSNDRNVRAKAKSAIQKFLNPPGN